MNLIFLPMAFLSGLWLPLQFMPKFLVDIAPIWPAYHLAQMALDTVGAPSAGTFSGHIAVLAGVDAGVLPARHAPHARQRISIVRRTAETNAGDRRRRHRGRCWRLSLSGVFGGKPASKEDATAATDAASAAAGTPALRPPAGVAAPAVAVIADFDSGSAAAAYGIGWSAAGDDMRGGNSSATQRLVDGGAGGSKGALEVTGAVGDAIQYPFAGTMFFPEGPPMQGLMDYSGKKTLTFQARGDGRRYMLMVISGLAGGRAFRSWSTSKRGPNGRKCGSISRNSAPRTGSACAPSAWAPWGPWVRSASRSTTCALE